jgi:hypothetical protein
MATLYNASPGQNFATFNPVSSALANLPNGAGTIAALYAKDASTGGVDLSGLVTGAAASPTDWYHSVSHQNAAGMDDDGLVVITSSLSTGTTTDWCVIAVTWPAGGAAVERFHITDQTTHGAWQHANSGNNGGNRAGPTTANGRWRIGYFADNQGSFGIGLSACWAGVVLTDLQIEELDNNNRTSDWWNCSGGQPTLLVECTSTTLTDIGANPSTFSSIGGMTIANPVIGAPTWNFDGRGATTPVTPLNPFQAIPFMSTGRI